MLRHIDRPLDSRSEADVKPEVSDGPTDFERGLAAARRQAPVIIVAAIVGLLFGVAYIVTAVPQYTAATNILIDSHKDKNDFSTSSSDLTYDSGAIDSQVEVLKSEKLALSVVSSLKLTSDPEFMRARSTLVDRALAMLRSAFDFSHWFVTRRESQPEEAVQLQRAAIGHLQSNLKVGRVARTYVLAIDFTAPDPNKAAAIANAYADAYITDQLDSKFEATRRAGDWLQTHIFQLKAASMAADLAVQKFRAENGLVAAEGKLVLDQRMTELNSQIMAARSDTAKAEARYNQITEMLKSGQTDGAVTDSLGSPVITDLRQKYLQKSKMAEELESKVGSGHMQVVSLRREMDDYQHQIFEELKRIAETYRSEVEVARAKEESFNKAMLALVSENDRANQSLVQLRELESQAETYRAQYQTYQQRYQDAVQQQSFPVTEARVITAASPPTVPSYPQPFRIQVMSLVLGSLVGAAIGALREHRDRVFRTASQVRDELGLAFLGMLQAVDRLPGNKASPGEQHDRKQITSSDPVQRYSIDHPLSSFSETLRSIKIAADLSLRDRKPKIIGVISVLPNEGKSTVSKNFASLLAHLGAVTLLIDGDLHHTGLTRSLASHTEAGLLEAIRGDRLRRDLLLSEPETGLLFMPTVISKRLHHTSEVLASPGMQSLLTEAGKDFDFIIIDLPPLAPVVDVRAAASLFDAFVLVIEWARTARQMVQTTLASDEFLYEKCLGAVFNKVQLNKMRLYEGYGSKDYYREHYTKYYRNEKEPA